MATNATSVTRRAISLVIAPVRSRKVVDDAAAETATTAVSRDILLVSALISEAVHADMAAVGAADEVARANAINAAVMDTSLENALRIAVKVEDRNATTVEGSDTFLVNARNQVLISLSDATIVVKSGILAVTALRTQATVTTEGRLA